MKKEKYHVSYCRTVKLVEIECDIEDKRGYEPICMSSYEMGVMIIFRKVKKK